MRMEFLDDIGMEISELAGYLKELQESGATKEDVERLAHAVIERAIVQLENQTQRMKAAGKAYPNLNA